jgi:hypothetical protein
MIAHPNRNKKTRKTPAVSSGIATAPGARTNKQHDLDYSALLSGARTSFSHAIQTASHVFTTDATGLWENYLAAIPGASERQVHNCNCCRRFIETYGNLVTIDKHGGTMPVMWDIGRVPEFYTPAFARLEAMVGNASVTGVFVSKATSWGTPETGEWQHLSVEPPTRLIHRNRSLEPNQVEAAVRENVKTVTTAMVAYSPAVLDEALRLFNTGVLERSEKFVGPVQWLRDLHDWPKGRVNQRVRQNLLWRAVAAAPEGYCHIRSSVVAPLLDDIVAGTPFEVIKRKHGAKTNSAIYQRPQAAPSAGNIAAAEALVAKLGIAPSLNRRFARIEDLELRWVPDDAPADTAGRKSSGVFGHLKAKGDRRRPAPPSVNIPPVTMTWEKFSRTVLDTARQIEVWVNPMDGFFAMTAADDANAPPIIKWDTEEDRNTVAWYTYVQLTSARQWKVTPGWATVSALTLSPNLWGERPAPFLGVGMMLIIEGAVDTSNSSMALFPEHLKGDLHSVWPTIEAFSAKGKLAGAEQASACGLRIGPQCLERTVRVHDGKHWTAYKIDRWD